MILYISEEYGYRHWLAELTDREYQGLIARWETMRGLNCLVPVTMIVPQAIEIEEGMATCFDRNKIPKDAKHCHIHECDDSRLEGTNYQIPEDEDFWICGVRYTRSEL